MIIRIVKLIIYREKVDEFQLFFEKTKPGIGNFIGCSHVELLKETKQGNIFFTYSHWKNEEMLQKEKSRSIPDQRELALEIIDFELLYVSWQL